MTEPAGRAIRLVHRRPTDLVYVLLHGLTATPLQFSKLGQALHDGGANVLIPSLPRHGSPDRMTDTLAALSVEELVAFASQCVDEARALGSHIVVVGFSLGGLLALWIAQHFPVERAVAIAPFLGVVGLPDRVGGMAARIALRMPNRFLWWHPLLRERLLPEHGYPRYPTHAVANLYRLVQALFAAARKAAPVATNITIVSNAREMAVNNGAARRLAHVWQAHGARTCVRIHRLRGLPPSHDVIEPLRSAALEAKVFPALLALLREPQT